MNSAQTTTARALHLSEHPELKRFDVVVQFWLCESNGAPKQVRENFHVRQRVHYAPNREVVVGHVKEVIKNSECTFGGPLLITSLTLTQVHEKFFVYLSDKQITGLKACPVAATNKGAFGSHSTRNSLTRLQLITLVDGEYRLTELGQRTLEDLPRQKANKEKQRIAF